MQRKKDALKKNYQKNRLMKRERNICLLLIVDYINYVISSPDKHYV